MAMQRQCAHVMKLSKKRCNHPAKPGRKHCALHAKKFIGKTPEARANQLANRELTHKSGNAANQHLRAPFVIEPSALAAKVESLSEGTLLQDEHGVPPNLRRTVLGAGKIELELEHYAALPKLTVREERRRELLERRLDVYLDRLGMSVDARVKTASLEAAAKMARVRRIEPVRTYDRALEVAQLLARSHALPPLDAEVAEREPEPEPVSEAESPVAAATPSLLHEEERVPASRLQPVADSVRRSKTKTPPGQVRVH